MSRDAVGRGDPTALSRLRWGAEAALEVSFLRTECLVERVLDRQRHQCERYGCDGAGRDIDGLCDAGEAQGGREDGLAPGGDSIEDEAPSRVTHGLGDPRVRRDGDMRACDRVHGIVDDRAVNRARVGPRIDRNGWGRAALGGPVGPHATRQDNIQNGKDSAACPKAHASSSGRARDNRCGPRSRNVKEDRRNPYSAPVSVGRP